MSAPLDMPHLADVSAADVATWLRSLGWRQKVDFPRTDVLVFEGFEDDRGKILTTLVPTDSTAPEFPEHLARVLRLVAAVTRRPLEALAAELADLHADIDRVQLRVLSDFARGGSIPLDYAATMVGALRDLVVAAACVEKDPRPAYARATKAAVEHAQACRFGQTRRGSFIATVECPVTPVIGDPTLPLDVPFERRVTERIVRGVAQVGRAVASRDAASLAEAWKVGLNANMCEALLRLRGAGDVTMEFSARWSPRVAAPADLVVPIRIDRESFDYVSATARALQPSSVPEVRTFIGKVVGLADSRASDDDDDDSDDGERVVTLRFDVNGRGRDQTARLHLDEADYRAACDAHRDGRAITLRGHLERRGKRWWIVAAEGFAPAS